MSDDGPHAGRPIETAGAPLAAAEAAVVMLHGRGDSASHFLRLADEFHRHGAMYLAPEAAGKAWFPGAFDAPGAEKEPWFSSALALVADAVELAADAGVPRERIVFVGFSQGACVAAEYVAACPEAYGGLAVLAGGLLGPDLSAREFEGSLDETPVFLGCGDADPHVSPDRVRDSGAAFRRLDAAVETRVYDGLGHAINDDEIARIDRLVGDAVGE